MTLPISRLRRGAAAGIAISSAAVAIGATTAGTASAGPATSACGKIAHCKVVKHVDVDGDGAKDTVAVVGKKLDKDHVPGKATVRVKTADGKLLTRSVNNLDVSSTKDIFRGAAKIDGRAGSELVISHKNGAHGSTYRVLTYRNGKLQSLPAPKAATSQAVGSQSDWLTDSALMSAQGISRAKKAGQPARVTVQRGAYSGDTKRLEGRVVTNQWQQNGRWHQVSSTKKSWPQSDHHFGGWHLKTLHGV